MPTDSRAQQGIPSPCVGICRLDAEGRYCLGCLRSLQEIAEWSTASDHRKLAILERLARLRAAAVPRS